MTEGEFAVIKMEVEREERRNYRNMMIEDIMEMAPGRYTKEELAGMSTKRLECIYDYC